MVFAQETRASRRPGAVARGLVPRSHAIRCRRVCSASAVQHVEVLWPGARLAPAGDKPPPYRRWRGRRSEPARLTSFARYPSGIAGTAESSSAVPAVLAGIRPAEARGLEQAACMAAGGGFWLHPLTASPVWLELKHQVDTVLNAARRDQPSAIFAQDATYVGVQRVDPRAGSRSGRRSRVENTTCMRIAVYVLAIPLCQHR